MVSGMREVLLALLAFGGFAFAFYLTAGWWAASRFREDRDPEDRFLSRAIFRAFWMFLLGTGLLVWIAAHSRPDLPLGAWVTLLYVLPLLWGWVMVLGSSWIEMRARDLGVGLWRFHRFNLFAAYMLWGQRIPFFSAAVAAPLFVLRGASLLPTAGLHLALAFAVGWAARVLVVNVLVGVLPFPDSRLAVEVRAAAREAGIRLRGVLLVPSEPGQSVNALVASSSRIIYVAEGLWKGLERDELRGVLLHEVAHLGQPLTNVFRNLSVFGWPIVLATGQIVVAAASSGFRAAIGLLLLLLLGLAGSALTRKVLEEAETGADLFAESAGRPGALGSALRKLYSGDLTPPGRRLAEEGSVRIQARLRALER
jgi:Zn-dependent protease with chaperone function